MDLVLSQSQKLTVTPQMIQSMEVLALNAVELKSYLENMSLSNPLISIEDMDGDSKEHQSEIDISRKLEWLSNTDRQNRVYYQDDFSANHIDNTHDPLLNGETIHDYLRAQIITHKYDRTDRNIVEYLIECVDERGYITEQIDTIAEIFGCKTSHIEHLLDDIKTLDPAGVGAASLVECLMLQLNRIDSCDMAKTIVLHHITQLGKKHYRNIAKELGTTLEKVEEAVALIQSLDPKPGASFASRQKLRYISPDAVIVKNGSDFTILINEFSYPKIGINSYYESLLNTTEDKEAIAYLKQQLEKVKEVQSNLNMRRDTLSRVVACIVDHQGPFFANGPGNKRPLYLSTISEELGLHVSTISRALSNKYLQCSFGVYPLNYFLTAAATKNTASGQDMTREEIYTFIRRIIDGEDKKKPLSDDAISKELKSHNIDISRRTVNKYRGLLGIPDKSARKSQ